MELKMRETRLSLFQLGVFSLPVLTFQAIELPWRIYLPGFFAQVLGLPLATVGALLMAIRLFDMALDPFIGWASDRFPTRFGLRRPWMTAGVPLVMLGTWQVFFAHSGIGMPALTAWCLVMHLGYTLMLTPHGGWGLEIAADEHQRTRIMGAKVWVAAAGMPLIVALPSLMERLTGAGRAQQVAAMGALLMVLAPVSAVLVLRFIPEPPVDRVMARRVVNPLRLLGTILRDRTLVQILGLYALVGVADASSAGSFVFFVEQGLDFKGWGSTLVLVQGLVVIVTLPLWAAISRRIGKRGTLLCVYGWQALMAPLALVLPAGQMAPLVLFLVLRNLGWGADYMLLRAMVADVCGQEAGQGLRRSGSYYALFNVTIKLAMGIGIGMALWSLERAGFTPGVTPDGHALLALRLVYSLPSALAGLVGVLILAGGIGGSMRSGSHAEAVVSR